MLEDLLAERAPHLELHAGYVVRTEDDHLYLAGGNHEPFLFKADKKAIDASSYHNFDANLKARRAYSARMGARYLHAVVPDKESVPTPALAPLRLTSHIDRYRQFARQPFLDLRPRRDMPDFFKRIDTHWAIPGEIDAAERIAKGFAIPDSEVSAGIARLREAVTEERFDAKGDLGKVFTPPPKEPQPRFAADWITTFNDKPDTGWNVGKVDLFLAPGSPDRRLLIFGDSCMHIAARMLTPFFRTILFCRSEFYHREMVDQMRPTHVLTEQMERFLRRVQSDDTTPRFLLLPHLHGRELKPATDFWKAMNEVLTPPRPSFRRGFAARIRAVFQPD